jgi:DNA mismatch repair protein MutS2
MKILLQAAHTLEFDKVLDFISIKCVSELGKRRLLDSQPFSDRETLEQALAEVTEVKQIYITEGGIPICAFDDIRILLNKIKPFDSYLEITDCQSVQNFLEIASDICDFFKKHSEICQLLTKYAEKIDPLPNLLKLIQNTIDPSGSIYDNASTELKKIRSQISVISKQIHIKLERIIDKQAEHLREEFISLRDGRLVIPVREFSVNKIPGIVHGQSATGQTHFVEPMSVVSLNNEIFELYNQEKREIIRILQRLSANVRGHKEALFINLENLIHMDVVQAKAQYSISINGEAPGVNDSLIWDIRNGFHPLLLKIIRKGTVPLTLKLGDDYRMIVITGPNAGGKTVTLKTIGLLQLLFQSGFHIPVDEGSTFPVCNQLAAVIGDEQSIENDLSTFSSHITKINEILKNPVSRSLILIDEIGSGTDPAEGSALAISMLEELNKEGIITVVTTHLGELKAFANRLEKAINAAMQFDFNTLSPLFILETGVPGSSYAFDISQRLGIDEKILDRARDMLGKSHNELENMIGDLTKKRQAYDAKIKEISIKATELEGLKSLYQSRADDLKKKRKKYEEEAIENAQEILVNVNRTIENVVREIKETQAEGEVVKKGRNEIQQLREKISHKKESPVHKEILLADLDKGQHVRSKRFLLDGQITKLLKDKEQVEIESGGIKVTVPLSDITVVGVPKESGGTVEHISRDSGRVINEIDLRGKIAEDALIDLDQYLDHAFNSDWHEVRIIHGKGTGALRTKIHTYLKKNKKIKSFRLGNYGEGDAGVTVIEL